MIRSRVLHFGLLVVVGAALGGCMPKMTIEEMKAEMPKRPAELDRLNSFVGTWQGEGTAKMIGLEQPLKITGRSEAQWDGDKWYVVSSGVMTMEHFDPMKGHETWTYDQKAKKYRSTWVDTMGMTGIGEARYDEKKNVWKMKAISYGPWGKSNMRGTLRFTDPDTMSWEWAEYMWFMKTMEMSGTSHRVK